MVSIQTLPPEVKVKKRVDITMETGNLEDTGSEELSVWSHINNH